MGRTIPSFRQSVAYEYRQWKPFRQTLSKSDRKLFDQMWDITTLYNSAMSNAVKPVRIRPILMSIIFHHYVQLTDLEKSLADIIDNKVHIDVSKMSNTSPSSITSENSIVSSREKCQNCKGRGYIEMSSTTATCTSCKGNGFIPSKTMMDYFG